MSEPNDEPCTYPQCMAEIDRLRADLAQMTEECEWLHKYLRWIGHEAKLASTSEQNREGEGG